MSAFGPKRTSDSALRMSAIGGKADMSVCGCLLSRSLLGVKRTSSVALHMSADDPKRTLLRSITPFGVLASAVTMPSLDFGGGHETSRVHHASRRCDSRLAARCTCTADWRCRRSDFFTL